ncbi:MAG: hypothetical protein EP340_06230 [Alphaproteobacteria bacterium]|nr:MAG: hypothetical protein EP340_06230 [Alphaproteobacteria bacterium]
MHQTAPFVEVLIFLLAAVGVVTAIQRLRTSPIIGYLIAGALIGPYGLALIHDSDSTHILAELGVIFLLFTIGLEFSFAKLRSMALQVFGLGGLQVLITAVAIAGVVAALGVSREGAIIIGGGLALSSTAFVLQLLGERGERSTPYGQTALAVLLFQDLAIVPLLMLVTLLGGDHGAFWSVLGMAILEAAVALTCMAFVGRLLLRPLYKLIAGTDNSELFVATTLLVILGAGWVLSLFDISMVLGAFLAGILLSETEYRHQIESDIHPFKGILLGLFFMTVGMSIDPAFIVNNSLEILAAVFALLIFKMFLTGGLTLLFKQPVALAIRTGFILSQGGEFGFVLFLAAGALGLLTDQMVQFLLTVVALTMVSTPFAAMAGQRLAELFEKKLHRDLEPGTQSVADQSGHIIIAGFGRVGQVVALLLRTADFKCVALDLDANRVSNCRTSGFDIYYGDASLAAILRAVGIERARALIVSIDQPASLERIISAAREVAPEIRIFTRARDLVHGSKLVAKGATEAVPESLEASIQLGSIALTSLGVDPDEAQKIVQEIRDDDYAPIRQEIE